jgi:dolichyl-phosphate beta-glucosyltransferase
MIPEISIIIAAYNEEARLPASLMKIHGYLAARNIAAEIIVVDDGSNDGTAAATKLLVDCIPGLRLISYAKNRGKGYALRTGVLDSQGQLVLLSDADLSTPIEELDSLMKLIVVDSFHVAIGSRALALSRIEEAQSWWRQGMGKIFNRIVKLLVIDDFSDTQCGFKLFTGDTARRLFSEARIDRFAYDVEILAMAKRCGYRIAEVPIKWINSPGSKVDPVKDSLQMLMDLYRIRRSVGAVKKSRPFEYSQSRTHPENEA